MKRTTTGFRQFPSLRTIAKGVRDVVLKHGAQRGMMNGINSINGLRDRYINDQLPDGNDALSPFPKIGVVPVTHHGPAAVVVSQGSISGKLSQIDASGNIIALIDAGNVEFLFLISSNVRLNRDLLDRLLGQSWLDRTGEVGAWEPRHMPLEQAKYYDPVTGFTNWISFGCALVRKEAFVMADGFNSSLAGTARDVDLSYRMRRAGFRLQYCPDATIEHPPIQSSVSIGDYLSLSARYFFSAGRGGGAGAAAHQPAYPLAGRGIDLNRTICPSTTVGSRPKVSIVVRTYRGRVQFLKQALQSLIRQTYPNMEIIVVEDGGNHQEEHVRCMVEIAKGTGKEIIYLSAEKVGRSETGNIGLQNASGDYIGFLDDDDLFFRDHVETLVNAVTAAKTAAAYGLAWAIKTRKADNANGYLETGVSQPGLYDQEFTHALLEKDNIFPIQSILFSRVLYDRHGGFDTTLEYLEDWNLWLRYADRENFTFVRKTTSMFRVPDEDALLVERGRLMEAARGTAIQKASESLSTLRSRAVSHRAES